LFGLALLSTIIIGIINASICADLTFWFNLILDLTINFFILGLTICVFDRIRDKQLQQEKQPWERASVKQLEKFLAEIKKLFSCDIHNNCQHNETAELSVFDIKRIKLLENSIDWSHENRALWFIPWERQIDFNLSCYEAIEWYEYVKKNINEQGNRLLSTYNLVLPPEILEIIDDIITDPLFIFFGMLWESYRKPTLIGGTKGVISKITKGTVIPLARLDWSKLSANANKIDEWIKEKNSKLNQGKSKNK
jgi:hypothetical protein